jgi:hypothetical protein
MDMDRVPVPDDPLSLPPPPPPQPNVIAKNKSEIANTIDLRFFIRNSLEI